MLKAFTLAFLFMLISSLGFSQSQGEIAAKFEGEFKSILVDARNNRFGAGDIAASYLTITDLIKTYKVKGKISILTNDESINILRKLAHGNQEFFDHVTIYSLDTLPADNSYDLYLSFANKNGQFQYERDFRDGSPDQKIHLAPNAVAITQTVLGNTENRLFHLFYATLRYQGHDYAVSVPGIGANEAGVYTDFVAKQLRGQSRIAIDQFLTEHLSLVGDGFSKTAIRSLIDGSKLNGANVGLAYGLSSKDKQQPQFLTYLQGLAASSDESFCVITPSSVDPQSGFTQASVTDPTLIQRLVFINDVDSMPAIAERGKIYIVRTQNLPHSVFVALVARSMKEGLVPVGAGDGFLSAALNLGGPFVLTQVPWNSKNVANYKALLIAAATKKFGDGELLTHALRLIDDIFGKIDLTHAQGLRDLSGLFDEIGRATPGFTERIVNSSYLIRHPETARPADFLDARLTESIDKKNNAPPAEPAKPRGLKPNLVFESKHYGPRTMCEKAAL